MALLTIMAASLLNLCLLENDTELEQILMLEGMGDALSTNTYDPTWPRFDLSMMTEDQSRNAFRFLPNDITRMRKALLIPQRKVFSDGSVASGDESLCITLRRLTYPCRLSDIEPLFGRPKSVLSVIINETIDHIYQQCNRLLTRFDHPWMDQHHLQRYAEAVQARGSPMTNCIGFVDGTVRPICRPLYNQKTCFNGHKRVHAIKFQSVVIPNGLIANLYGPMEGRRHDCALLNESRLLESLQGLPRAHDGKQYALYGDPAYPLRPELLAPYRGAHLTPDQQLFNARMSSVRESVEWMFGKILNIFAFLDFKKNLKVFLQPVAKYYLVGAILTNCHTCLYGSITSQFFNLDPPTLEEYLNQ